MMHRMKVTAILPDALIQDVSALSQGESITQSLIKALSEWVALKKITQLNKKVQKNPLQFGTSAQSIRKANRR